MLDIVIPTYGDGTRLENTLLGLSRAKEIKNIGLVLVVENGKKFNAESVCKKFEELFSIKYIYTSKQGLVSARNVGVCNSISDYILFIDDDIEIHGNMLESYHQAINEHGDAYFYGGALYPDYEKTPPQWIVKYLPWSAKEYFIASEKCIFAKPVFLGGNICVPKLALINAGSFEGPCASGYNQGGVGEEMRLQEKLLAGGLKACWIPEASGKHWIPENKCNKEFVIQRYYRYGLTEAQNDKESYSMIFNVPRWLYKKIFIENCLFIYEKMKFSKEIKLFELQISISRLKGLIHGFKSRASLNK